MEDQVENCNAPEIQNLISLLSLPNISDTLFVELPLMMQIQL